jgi:hypothetical protein
MAKPRELKALEDRIANLELAFFRLGEAVNHLRAMHEDEPEEHHGERRKPVLQ